MKALGTTWRSWRIDAAGAGVCVALTLAFYLAAVRPMLTARAERDARKGEWDDRRAHAARLEAALTAARGRLESVRQDLARKGLRLLPVSMANARLAEISELAQASGLKIEEIQPGQVRSTEHYEAVSIHLAGSGTFRTCVTFLRRLREAFPDTGVTALELTANAAEPSAPGTSRFDLTWHAVPAAGSGGQ